MRQTSTAITLITVCSSVRLQWSEFYHVERATVKKLADSE